MHGCTECMCYGTVLMACSSWTVIGIRSADPNLNPSHKSAYLSSACQCQVSVSLCPLPSTSPPHRSVSAISRCADDVDVGHSHKLASLGPCCPAGRMGGSDPIPCMPICFGVVFATLASCLVYFGSRKKKVKRDFSHYLSNCLLLNTNL
jgi:hypothetical protein